jgi:DNA-binding Lrp family transcriptional regulator
MKEGGKPPAPPSRKLSLTDKKLLTVLLQLNGRVSSNELAAKLGIPRTTVQRRRHFVEENFLELMYALKLKDLGYSRVDLLIYTGGGNTIKLAETLLGRDEVVYVATSIGEHTINLRAEVIIKDTSQLLDLLEDVKAMASVKDVVWTEIVRVVGRKKSVPASIIDKL